MKYSAQHLYLFFDPGKTNHHTEKWGRRVAGMQIKLDEILKQKLIDVTNTDISQHNGGYISNLVLMRQQNIPLGIISQDVSLSIVSISEVSKGAVLRRLTVFNINEPTREANANLPTPFPIPL